MTATTLDTVLPTRAAAPGSGRAAAPSGAQLRDCTRAPAPSAMPCLAAGTLIHTQNGLQAIDQVRVGTLGDELLASNGEPTTKFTREPVIEDPEAVRKILEARHNEYITYNIEVEDLNNYFVGTHCVLVHNCNNA